MTRPRPSGNALASRIPGADPRIYEFFEAWNDLRAGRLVPRKAAFDPSRVASLLNAVWLYRFDADIDDFVCSLAGENVNDAWGRSIRGRCLRDIVGEKDHPVVLRRWQQIVSVPLIHYGAIQERMSRLATRRAERLIVPLTDDNDVPAFTLGLSLYAIDAGDPNRSALVPEDITQIRCADL